VVEVVGIESLGMELMGFDSFVAGFGSLVEWWRELGSLGSLVEDWQ